MGAARRRIPTHLESLNEEYQVLRAYSTSRLWRELRQALRLTATHYRRIALLLRCLTERKEDLSDARELLPGMMRYMRQVGYGQVLPEVIVRFNCYPLLLRSVAALPLPDQQRLYDGDPVAVVVPGDKGRLVMQLKSVLELTQPLIHQVFHQGRIRTESEQRTYLQGRRRARRAAAREGAESPPRVVPHPTDESLLVDDLVVPAPDVVNALTVLVHRRSKRTRNVPRPEQVVVPLSAEELTHLNNHAQRAGVAAADLVRTVLRVGGLLSGAATSP